MSAGVGGPVRRRSLAALQRARLLVAAAAAATGVVGASAGVAVAARRADVLGLGAAAAGIVLLSALAGSTNRSVRRASARLLPTGAAFGALGVAVLTGVAVALLLLGRIPATVEQAVVLPFAAGVATGAVAYPWLRRRAVSAAGRAALGRRRSPQEVLSTFADRASRGVPVEELVRQLAESLHDTMRLHAVQVWTGDAAHLERTLRLPDRPARVPRLDAAAVRVLARADVAGEGWLRHWLPALADEVGSAQVRLVTARHSGTVLGLLVLERSAAAERFTADDERMLADVGRGLGVVLHNRRLDAALQATLDDLRASNADLQASRARIVAAADAERRRIERDIHDGAQQHLVALAVGINLARDLVRSNPDAATDLLREAVAGVHEAISQVRDLAHGIYPPLLVEAGLVPAVRAAAVRTAVPVSVHGDIDRRLPGEIEAAAYFCCLEALQNIAKHAPGVSDVRVELRHAAGALHFTVTDDGPGFDPDVTRPGHGLRNMADRVGAVGGTVVWDSRPGAGTTVQGVIPVPEPAS